MSDGGVAVVGFSDLNTWLLRTDANGDTLWTQRYPGSGGNSFDKTSDGGFVIVEGIRLIRTNAAGDLLWSKIFDGLANSVKQTNDGGYIVAGYNFSGVTNDDLWLAKFSGGTTSIENSVEKPEDFFLYQNFPNPFNPTTIISYNIPSVISTEGRNLRVLLKVYDVLGNEVATLVDEYKPAGSYEVAYSASFLSSGVYFYQLKAGSFVETKKMILLR
ncbi:MAG: T9SS type A sorting domain-containing protein [Ignavibacterium sp.]|nr:T9SS type A sorting domain-containing protein [Ignavibacterium sp.]